MKRRGYLRSCLVFPLVGTAGCLGKSDNSILSMGRGNEYPELPPGMEVEDHFFNIAILPGGDEYAGPPEENEPHKSVLTNYDSAMEKLVDHERVKNIVEETDFDQSYLIAITSSPFEHNSELILNDIERPGRDQLEIYAEIRTPENVDDALSPKSLLIRVTDDKAPPEKIDLNIIY